MEIWKDIGGYEGLYQVSNLGRVKSCDRTVDHARLGKVNRSGRVLKQFQDEDGYFRVGLYKDGNGKSYPVHRLVAIAFVPNPSGKETVNHISGDKHNNRPDNLEWNTQKENLQHAHRTGLVKKPKITAKLVAQYDKDMNLIKTYPSIAEAGRMGFNRQSISKCCNGHCKTSGGYLWKIVE